MDWTPEQEARYQQLAGLLGTPSTTAQPERPGFMSRLGQGFANVPSNIAGGLANAGINIANYGQIPQDRFANVNVPKPYDLPPARDWSESLADVIPGLTAAVGTAMIPGGAVARGAQFLGAGSGTAAILGDIAGGAVLGASQSPGEAAGTGTEFGLLGAANRFLPVPWKIAANAAIPIAGQLLRGHDVTSRDSLISMGANVLTPALLGQYARRGETPTGREGALTHQVDPNTGAIIPYIPPPRGFTMPGYTRPGMSDPVSESAQWINPQPIPPDAPLALPGIRPLLRQGDAIQTGYTDPTQAAWEGIEPSAQRQAQLVGAPPQGFQPPERQQLLLRGPEPAQPAGYAMGELQKSLTLADAARSGDVLEFGGAQGRLVERPDGYFFRRFLGGEQGEQRVFGAVPDAPISEVEGLSLSKLARQREAAPEEPFARQLLGRRDREREGGFIDSSNPLLQYGAGAIAGGVINPLVDQDPKHSLLRKIAVGAGLGAGFVGMGKWAANIPGIARSVQMDMGVRARPPRRQLLESAPPMRTQAIHALVSSDLRNAVSRVKQFNPTSAELAYTESLSADMEARRRAGNMDAHLDERMKSRALTAAKSASTGLNEGVKTNTAAITDAYRKLVQETGYPDVRIADLQRESGAPVSDVQSFLKDQWQTGKAVLAKGEPSYLTPEQRAAGVDINGDTMHTARLMGEAPEIGGGMGLLGMKFSNVREAIRRKAAEQERDPKRFLEAPGQYLSRALETQFGLGKPDNLTFAQERGKGEANLLREQQEPARVGLLRAQTEDPAGYKAAQKFLLTKREPSDVAQLQANAAPETAKAALDYSGVKIKGQGVLYDATGNPMYKSTPEYQGGFYEAFANPKEWRKKLATDPSMKGDLVNALIRDNVIPGAEKWEVEQAVDGFAKGTIAGQEFEGQSNAATISRHLSEHKKDLTPEYRKFLGEYTDPVQREILTVHKLIGSVAQARTISVLDEMGGLGKMPGGADKLPILDRDTRRAEYAKAQAAGNTAKMEEMGDLVQVSENPAFGKLSGKFVPRSVSDALNAQNEVWQGGWMRSMSGATSWMKQALTLYNPGTHGRQILQIPMAAAIARVAPWDIVSGLREWKNNPQMREEILRNHISGADISSQDLKRGALEMDSTFNPDAKDRALSKVTSFHRLVQKIYGLPDNIVRITAYIKNRPRFFAEGNAKGLAGDELRTYTERETTKWVNNHTMNYGIVPQIVKIARETPFVSPFVSYQQQMLKLLTVLGQEAISGSGADRAWAVGNLGMLIGVPLMLAAYAKGQLSPGDQKEWDRAQRLSPEYSGAQIRVPLGRNKDGSFRYMNIANIVPAGDTAAMLRNLANGEGGKLFAGNPFIGWEKSPILNLVTEQVKWRENVTDRKLEGVLDRTRAAAKQMLPPLTPGVGYEWDRLQSGFTRNAQGGLGLTNARTGRVDTPGSALLRQAGIPLSTVRPTQLLRRAQSDFNEEKASAGMEFRQTRDTNATPAARQAAQDKYMATVREKQRQLLERTR